jgi:hypothetical protein
MYNTLKVQNYKMFQRQCFVPNISTSLQTTLAAEAHLAEGQFNLIIIIIIIPSNLAQVGPIRTAAEKVQRQDLILGHGRFLPHPF